jgi:hypothetical protein
VDKAEEEEERENLEEEAMIALTGPINRIKQTCQPVPLTVAIRDPSLTKQKLSVIDVKNNWSLC